MSVRVVIVDDHPVVRDGLRFSIERSGEDILVVGEAGDGQQLLELAGRVAADVHIVDVTMPVLNGIEATRELLRRQPAARVLMLSFLGSESVVGEALRAGARGFLTKETATRCVVDAILAIHAGRYYFSPDVAKCLVKPFLAAGRRPEEPRPAATAALTPREREILQLLAEGRTTKEIATLLALSTHTVHRHRNNLMAKLELHDIVALTRYALREGIAKP